MNRFLLQILFLFLLVLSPAFAEAQLSANFTADVVAGCSPLVVNFHNTTTPMSGTTFDWYGVGTGVLHLTDVSGSYIAPGTYVVTLTAHNGSSSSSHSVTITVYPAPTVSFFANDTTICPGTAVTFTSTSVSGVPGPVTCTWNFGDGSAGSGSTATHTYTAPGTYNVTLSVTNSDGCVSSLTKIGYMTVYTPPVPNFSASATYFCHPPGHVVFTNATTGFGPLSYIWRFGDGSAPSPLLGPTHDYTSPGAYTVTLVATDGHGCTDSLVAPAYINVSNLAAHFTFPSSACVNTPVTFPNTSSTHLTSSWNFGDGHTSSADTGVNIFSTPGTFTVTLIISDGGSCFDTVSHTITINPGPVATFTITPAHACPPPVSVSFAATVPPGTMVSWLYGDGTSGAGTSTSHFYTHRGVDTIRMICVGATGCIDTVTQLDTLYDIQHWITATPYSGCYPLPVNFSSYQITYEPDTTAPPIPYPFPVTSYSWDFGDGSAPSSLATPSHTYTAVGTYTAVLTFVTSNGCTFHDTTTILVGSPPVATFTATPLHQCYRNNGVTLVATVVSGPIDSFVWLFSDGGGLSSPITSGFYHFTHPGIFTATLTPYYHGCPGPPFVLGSTFIIDSPMAAISDSVYCVPARRVLFRDMSLGDDTHVWIFGDGATSTLDNPIHDYPLPTLYTVTLATYNITSGCRDTAVVHINLTKPTVSFVAIDSAVCKDSIVKFVSTVTGGTVLNYAWHMSAKSADSSQPTSIDTFHVPGIYTITLITQDQNLCFDTTVKANYVLIAHPVPHFTVSPTVGCWPLTTVFTDASTDVTGTFFTNFLWTFGDGGTASVSSPSVSHTFTSAGTFTTKEIVTDNIGCKDSITQTLVTVYRPTATFSASSTHLCKWDSTLFNNLSTGIVSSLWFFGDGVTSSVTSPWHTYTATGSYTVKLVVTDVHGCTDTATAVNYISITQPHASFYMSDSVSICPPLSVVFNNTSTGGSLYSWSLGGGAVSALFSPTNLYTSTGYDTIRLIVTDMYGCHDTAYGHVNIFGYAGAFSYSPLTGCAPLLVHFNASTINVPNIIWDFADGHTSAVSYTDTISHIYSVPGGYVPKLILSDNTGCQNSSIGLDTIKVDAIYPKITTFPDPVCVGDTFFFIDSSYSYWSSIVNRLWTFNGVTSTLDSPSFYISVVGTYPVTIALADGWGCTDTMTQDIHVYDLPVITASADTIICVGDAATLTGYGGLSYTWSPPGTLGCVNCNPASASPTVVTTYTVVGKDIHGCKNWDTVTVLLRTHTFGHAAGDTEICAGMPIPLFDSGGTKYNWIPAAGLNDPHLPDPVATPTVTTNYMVIVQLAGCIPDTNYVNVIVHPFPTVDAGPDQRVVEGASAQLGATGRYIHTYKWDDPQSLNCDTCANPVATVSVTTTYTVTVASDFGCKSSDTVTVRIFCDKSQIFLPNSFTPNNDGQNDVFYPRGTGVSVVKSFRIYNRWGQMLFERSNINLNDASNAWDGWFEGDPPRADVFVYVVEAICETGEPIFIKGDVTIIR